MNLPPPPASAASAALIQQCRETFVRHAAECLAGLRDRLIDLGNAGGMAAPPVSQRAQLVARWEEAQSTLLEALHEFAEEKLRFAENSRAGQPMDFTASTLKLVDDIDLEFGIALDETGTRLREASEAELYKLEARLAHVMGLPEIDPDHNPVGPVALVYGLRLVLERLDLPLPERLWLLAALEGEFRVALPLSYSAINALLVERGVLPRVSFGGRHRDDQAPGRRGEPGAAAGLDAVARFRQRMGGFGTGGGAPMDQDAVLRALDTTLKTLTRLQRLDTGEPSAPDSGAAGKLRTAWRNGDLAGVEPAAVEMVSRVFDGIFADPHLPPTLAALLGWLQMPVLKLALVEPGFFDDAGHPMRALLDSIGRIGQCLPADVSPDAAALRVVKSVVARVREQFDRDPALIAEWVEKLHPFASGMGLPGAPAAEATQRCVARYVNGMAAQQAAASVVDGLLPGLAPEVAKFLDRDWRQWLTQAYGDAATWQAASDTARDLAWSVAPKSAPEDRKRLLAVLPAMVKNLNIGLDAIAAPKAGREAFLNALMALHSAAMRPGPAAPAGKSSASKDESQALWDGSAPPQLRWETDTDAECPAEFAWLAAGGVAAVDLPQPGDCMDLHRPYAPPRRCYLMGPPRAGATMIFASVGGGALLLADGAAYARLLRDGTLRPVKLQPLLARAVERALSAGGSAA